MNCGAPMVVSKCEGVPFFVAGLPSGVNSIRRLRNCEKMESRCLMWFVLRGSICEHRQFFLRLPQRQRERERERDRARPGV